MGGRNEERRDGSDVNGCAHTQNVKKGSRELKIIFRKQELQPQESLYLASEADRRKGCADPEALDLIFLEQKSIF